MICDNIKLPVIPDVPTTVPDYDAVKLEALYDSITKLVKRDLDEQLQLGRIKGTEYANIYSILMKDAMQLAFTGQLEAQKISAANFQVYMSQADAYYKQAQVALTCRQTKGFDDDLNKKMIELQMNAWSVMFSSGSLDEKPDIISGDALSDLYYKLVSDINEEVSFILGDSTPKTGSPVKFAISNFSTTDTYTALVDGVSVTITTNTFEAPSKAPGQITDVALEREDAAGIKTYDAKKITWR